MRCLLWVQDDKWVGPVDLERRSGTSSYILAQKQNLDPIRSWKIPSEAIQQVELDGSRLLLAPNQDKLGQHLGLVTWESDQVLAKRVLTRLRKRDRKTAEALKISKEVFRSYIETIEQAGLVGSQLEQELAFRERIDEIIDVISHNDELLDEAASVCFAIDPLKDKMEEKAEEEYLGKLKEHETRLEEDLAKKRADLEVVIQNLSNKETELSSKKEQIQALDKKLNDRVSGFETELNNKLRELAEKPERHFAEIAIARAFIPKVGSNSAKPRDSVQRRIEGAGTDLKIVEDTPALMGALSTRLLYSRISPIVGQALHTTLLSGLIPVLIGPESYDLISAYVDCVSGGVLHWIPVGGSLFEPADLLARFDTTSRCLIPHPGRLLDLLLDESGVLHIVVLDGFNRAAVDGYLIPLLQSLQDVAQGRKPRWIPLAPPGFTREDEFYPGISSIAWNRNVLLMLCPSAGSSTLPVPVDFWGYCAVLDAGAPAPVGMESDSEVIPPMTRVPSAVWQVWYKDIKRKAEPIELLKNQLKEAGALPSIILDNLKNLCSSGTFLGLKPERALEQAVRATLFPYLVATEEPVEVWFKHLGVDLNEADRKIGEAIRHLGE